MSFEPTTQYSIEVEGELGGQCDCCGSQTRRVWGWIHSTGRTVGSYFVQWTVGQPDHGARIELVIGPWGEGTTPHDRSWSSIDFALTESGPSFCVRDADDRLSAIAAHALKRDEIIGTPLARQCFDLLDTVWLDDPRIEEVVGWA